MKHLAFVPVLLWYVFCIGGCAYIVFWKGRSPLWFLLAVFLCAGVNYSSKDGVDG